VTGWPVVLIKAQIAAVDIAAANRMVCRLNEKPVAVATKNVNLFTGVKRTDYIRISFLFSGNIRF